MEMQCAYFDFEINDGEKTKTKRVRYILDVHMVYRLEEDGRYTYCKKAIDMTLGTSRKPSSGIWYDFDELLRNGKSAEFGKNKPTIIGNTFADAIEAPEDTNALWQAIFRKEGLFAVCLKPFLDFYEPETDVEIKKLAYCVHPGNPRGREILEQYARDVRLDITREEWFDWNREWERYTKYFENYTAYDDLQKRLEDLRNSSGLLSGYIFRQSLKGKDAEETGKYLVSFVVAAIFIIAYEPVKTACPEKSEKLSELIQEKLPPDGDAPVKRFDDAINSFYSDVLRMAVQTEYFLSINPDDMDLLQLFKKLVMILNLNPEFRKDRFYNTSSSPSSEADDTGTLEITGDNYSKEHL